MVRSRIAGLLAVGFVVGGFAAVGQADDPQRGRDIIMQQKLGHAQKLLEGLAIKDFAIIEKHADELGILSKRAEWLVLKTPEYTRHSDDFRRHCETMSRMAKEKNLDGCALAYVQMTMSCVNCHKYVREVRIAQATR